MKNKSFQITRKHLFALSGILATLFLILVIYHTKNYPASSSSAHEQPDERSFADTLNVTYSNEGIVDFGDPNFKKLVKKLSQLGSGKERSVVNIIQFGDSHTASETITATMRTLLQQQFGNAGIGWITPMNVPVSGQRHSLISFQSQDWQLVNSLTVQNADFAMGGYIATPIQAGATITVTPRQTSSERWIARFTIKSSARSPLIITDANGQRTNLNPANTSNWQEIEAEVTLPITISATEAYSTQLGGIWLAKKNASGVTVSPIGTSGMQQTNWRTWTDQWPVQLTQTRADLIIISYGTNEAFNSKLDIHDMENALRLSIKIIRKSLPESTIVIVGAPDSMRRDKSAEAGCTQRQPAMLHAVKQTQRKVAQQEKTLFWDWQQAMGGDCAILNWQQNGLATKDLVHLNNQGYQRSGTLFYNDLMELARIGSAHSP